MARHKNLVEIATRHQVLLERLKTRYAQDFSKVLPELETAILDVVSALRIARMSELKHRELTKLLLGLRDKQSRLIERNTLAFSRMLRNFSDYETGFEVRSLQSGLSTSFAVLSVAVPSQEKAFAAALRSPISATGQLLQPFIAQWGQRHVAGVDNAVRRAWGEGRTVQQLVQEIRGTRAKGYRDGLVNASRVQAQAVARTAVQHVASTARQTTWERNADVVQGYIWVSTLDTRTTTRCRSLDGRKFKLGEGPKPPLHINCRSTTVADVGPQFDFLDEGATRSAENGPVDAKLTYYDWLKKQTPGFQDAAIGPTRGQLFRKGGLTSSEFSRLNLNRNFEPLTLDEMRKLEPEAFRRAGL